MTVLTQGINPLEFLISEATGQRARDSATVTVAGSTALPSGTVLGRITATGKLVAYNDAGTDDGRRTAVAILGTALPGTNGDYKAQVFTRDCEVWASMLTGLDANGRADLAAVGIIVR